MGSAPNASATAAAARAHKSSERRLAKGGPNWKLRRALIGFSFVCWHHFQVYLSIKASGKVGCR